MLLGLGTTRTIFWRRKVFGFFSAFLFWISNIVVVSGGCGIPKQELTVTWSPTVAMMTFPSSPRYTQSGMAAPLETRCDGHEKKRRPQGCRSPLQAGCERARAPLQLPVAPAEVEEGLFPLVPRAWGEDVARVEARPNAVVSLKK